MIKKILLSNRRRVLVLAALAGVKAMQIGTLDRLRQILCAAARSGRHRPGQGGEVAGIHCRRGLDLRRARRQDHR
jgi:hypothetical protein